MFPSTRGTTTDQNITKTLLDLRAISWLILFQVCCSMRSPFFSRRKIMYNFTPSVSISLLFDCQLSFRRFDTTLINVDFTSSTVHGYTEMMLMNSCRRRFHVNSICFFFTRKFQFLRPSLSLWKWINEEMKAERDIQRIKTQSRYRWTQNFWQTMSRIIVISRTDWKLMKIQRFLIWLSDMKTRINSMDRNAVSHIRSLTGCVFPCNHNNDKWITNTTFKLTATKSSNICRLRRLIRHDREASDKLGIRCHFFLKLINPKIESWDRKLRYKFGKCIFGSMMKCTASQSSEWLVSVLNQNHTRVMSPTQRIRPSRNFLRTNLTWE